VVRGYLSFTVFAGRNDRTRIMVGFALDHIAHAAGTVAVLNLPEKAKSVVPMALSIAGFTPVQIEILVTGFALLAQALIFAALRVKTALPTHAIVDHRLSGR
jgi:hypothetical protein